MSVVATLKKTKKGLPLLYRGVGGCQGSQLLERELGWVSGLRFFFYLHFFFFACPHTFRGLSKPLTLDFCLTNLPVTIRASVKAVKSGLFQLTLGSRLCRRVHAFLLHVGGSSACAVSLFRDKFLYIDILAVALLVVNMNCLCSIVSFMLNAGDRDPASLCCFVNMPPFCN